MKPALLVIDMQKEFSEEPRYADTFQRAIELINAAIALFRARQLPVIAIQHTSADLPADSEGFAMPESIELLPGDARIVKTYGNAFTKTPLRQKLQELGVDTLILTGFCAEYCVLSTYRGALDQDLKPIILRGALASPQAEHIRFVEEISDLISYGALKTFLQSCLA